MLKEVHSIFMKDLKMEWRQSHAIGSVFLYVISSIFVAYMGFKQIVNLATWNALFWIIILFAAFNASYRSFAQETQGRKIYLYTLASPQAVIIGKMLYNALLLTVMVMVSALVYSFMLGVQALDSPDYLAFVLALFLGAIGLSFILTLIAAIASQSDNNLGLMAILGLPVILPLLLVLIRFSKNALDGIAWSVNANYMWQLIALAVLSLALSYVLFPYLWRD